MQDQDARDESSLPAPYQSPWEALRQDFPAAAADLRLRLQELWRRNREGDLSTPGFWPQDLAALFWPLVLIALMLMLCLGVVQLRGALDVVGEDSMPVVERIRTTPLPEARPLMSELESLPDPVDAPATAPQQSPVAPDQPALIAPAPLQPDPPLLQVDPLLDLLAEVEAAGAGSGGLLQSARPVPAENAAVLVVHTGRWSALPPSVRLERAESWWRTLQDQGYDSITLQDTDQHLLARPARVGGGMIMFDPSPSP